MEEDYGYVGREGDGLITLYREEVDLQLPVAESETFNIVNVTPVFRGFKGQQYYVRGEDTEIDFKPTFSQIILLWFCSPYANVTMENDPNFSGAIKLELQMMVGHTDGYFNSFSIGRNGRWIEITHHR